LLAEGQLYRLRASVLGCFQGESEVDQVARKPQPGREELGEFVGDRLVEALVGQAGERAADDEAPSSP